MNNENDFYHFLANLAYQAPEQRDDMLRSQFGDRMQIAPDFNNDEFATVIDGDTIYNLHRGTVNSDDVLTDVQLASGSLEMSPRYNRSKQFSEQSVQKYGGSRRVVEVGHSLGGALAETISQGMGTESYAFNMGTTPLKSYSQVDRTKHRHIRTEGDVVSAFDNSGKATNVTDEKPTMFERRFGEIGWQYKGLHHWNALLRALQRHKLASQEKKNDKDESEQ